MELLAPYMDYIITAGIALAVLLVGLLVYKLLSGPVMGRKGQRLGISEYHEIDKTQAPGSGAPRRNRASHFDRRRAGPRH